MDIQRKNSCLPDFLIAGIWLILLFGVWVPAALAHGTSIQIQLLENDELSIQALFDTGEPMAEAQIAIYAPDNPRQAWHTGVADSNGNYSFVVDTSLQGQWSMTIRTAGHGEVHYLNVARDGSIELSTNNEQPLWQTIFKASAVFVGLGGIAFWYSRPHREKVSRMSNAHT